MAKRQTTGKPVTDRYHAKEQARCTCRARRGCGLMKTAQGEVFSNHNNSSGAEVFVVEKDRALDADRYNASFIDTRVNYAGEDYYTTVRLMCIGEVITHAFVRARPVSEGNPRVHGKDTPVKRDLLRGLHHILIERNQKGLERLAKDVVSAIGPGFYAHDVLIDARTHQIFLAETGFKLDNLVFYKHMAEIIEDLPSMKGFSNPAEVAKNTAPVFIDLLEADRNANKSAAPSSGPSQ